MSIPSSVGRYRIERVLGSGAFASVWLGHDDVLEAPVAIKVLAGSLLDDLDVRNRFLEEARILRRADSERLVRVHDIGDLPDGRPYFVMSYADRGALADRLKDHRPLPVGHALYIAEEIAHGVEVINRLGVIHRDLKPSNILFQSTPDGGERLLIADLGLAKALAHASGAFTLPVGTPGYMSPEQTRFGGGLDVRADVYGIGALTYHLLTGRPPGPAPVRMPPSAAVPGLPRQVDEVIMRAVHLDREQRFPTAEAFAKALAGLRTELPTPVGGVPIVRRPRAPWQPPAPEPAAQEPAAQGQAAQGQAAQEPAGHGQAWPVQDEPGQDGPEQQPAPWRQPAAPQRPMEAPLPPGAQRLPPPGPPPPGAPPGHPGPPPEGSRVPLGPPAGPVPPYAPGPPAPSSDDVATAAYRLPSPPDADRTAVDDTPAQRGGAHRRRAGRGRGERGAVERRGARQDRADRDGTDGGRDGGREGARPDPAEAGPAGSVRRLLVPAGIALAILAAAIGGGLVFGNLFGGDGAKSGGKSGGKAGAGRPANTGPPAGFSTVRESKGHLSVTVPTGWAKQQEETWRPATVGLAGDQRAEPVLRATPDLTQFRTLKAATPGVFVGMTRDLTPGRLPPPAVSRHPNCRKEPTRPYRRGTLNGTITRWVRCDGGPISFSEIGLVDTSGRFGMWIRVKQIDNNDLTRRILDSLQVRAP
ncbi:MAG TPA: protein kinase [Streptosporangiaceae bacterium]